jgi:DNA invertase Pin-like site-specific DNA recombinase
MSEKIQPSHLERVACVYVRQSSMGQVRHHLEGGRRQYELEARARQLGFREVLVIDEDMGVSGAGTQERRGFGRLLALVCEGRVGAVLALEASRLARNNRDWHHLLDLCVLTETLVIDPDGVYDPSRMNDRLLLGLKGTMSEFELGLMRQRALEAFQEMVRRGEVLSTPAVGYVRTEDNRLEMTPDRQVQEAVRGVFAKFRELGSVRQVLLWYRQEGLPLPTHRLVSPGVEVVWRLPVYRRVLSILKNPVYAGAFAYGRTRTRTAVVDGRARKSRGVGVHPEDWAVLIRDHHAGYIGWEEYEENQRQVESNAAMHGKMNRGAAKGGRALLAGLLRCARCGRKFHVAYSGVGGRVPRYSCLAANLSQGAEPCIAFGGLSVDAAVARAVLEALGPAGMGASMDAWRELSSREDGKRKSLELAAQRARYEAERARRQYDAAEPENRLVAAELETRWNAAIERLTEAEAHLRSATAREGPVTEAERRRLLALGEDLTALWDHPAASVQLKKRILRTVIEEIVANIDEGRSEIVLHLHWAGGVHTRLVVAKNRRGHHGKSTDREVVDLVRELAKVCGDASIANILNRLGYRTGAGNTWTQARVLGLRAYQEIPAVDRGPDRSWITLEETAEALGVSAHPVRRLIQRGILPARQVVRHAPWIIERRDLELPEVRHRIQAIRDGHRLPWTAARQSAFPFLSTT